MIESDVKRCGRCKEEKLTSEFYRRDGGYLQSVCKPCSIRLSVARNKKRRIERGKRCQTCKILKPDGEFRTANGGTLSYYCRQCESKWQTPESVQLNRSDRHDFEIKNPLRARAQKWRTRRKRDRLVFDKEYFTIDRLVDMQCDTPYCLCCGVKIDYNYYTGRNLKQLRRHGPSLDRLDSTKDYVAGNVKIICYHCNTLKNDATLEEARNIVRYMEKYLAA